MITITEASGKLIFDDGTSKSFPFTVSEDGNDTVTVESLGKGGGRISAPYTKWEKSNSSTFSSASDLVTYLAQFTGFNTAGGGSSASSDIQTVTFSRTLTADSSNGIFTNDVISELPDLTSGVYAPIDVEIIWTMGNTNFRLQDYESVNSWAIGLGGQSIEFLDRNCNYLYHFLQNATAGKKIYFRGVWSNSSAEISYMATNSEHTPCLEGYGFNFVPMFLWENGDTTTTVQFTVRYKILL